MSSPNRREYASIHPVPPPAAPDTGAHRSLSAALADLTAHHRGERISVGDLVTALGGRAFGALMLAFAAPNLPPLGIPGLSSICAVPLFYRAWQMAAGRPAPLLPRWLLARSVPARAFAGLIRSVGPSLSRVERLLKPRVPPLSGVTGHRAAGAVALAMAAVLFLPIPLGNLLPALAIAALALGLSARDGIAVLSGYLVAAAGLAVVAGVVIASAGAILWIWEAIV